MTTDLVKRLEEYPSETELPDDYPIYADYLYVGDGKVIRSDYHGITARQFKVRMGIKKLCRCDIASRQAALKAKDQS